jgi:hypothetical protein
VGGLGESGNGDNPQNVVCGCMLQLLYLPTSVFHANAVPFAWLLRLPITSVLVFGYGSSRPI